MLTQMFLGLVWPLFALSFTMDQPPPEATMDSVANGVGGANIFVS